MEDENTLEIRDNKSEENIIKITSTKTAGAVLAKIVDKVNDGFEGGKVHRQDVASWIIEYFNSICNESAITQIRQANYNPTDMLEAVYRKMKETGEVPDFLKDALQKQFQNTSTASKKNKKQLKSNSINDGVNEYEEAA